MKTGYRKTAWAATALLTLAVGLPAAPAAAAGYLKLDGIDGEAKAAPSRPTGPTQLKPKRKDQSTGLLLPAVQKARDGAAKPKPNPDAVKPKGAEPRGLLLPAIQKAR